MTESLQAFHPVSGAGAVVLIVAAAATMALIVLLQPLLRQYALARPNHRSSHTVPTPQGGGIAVIAVTIIVVAVSLYVFAVPTPETLPLAWIMAAALMLAVVGAIDDIRVMEALPRLLLQAIAVGVVVAALPAELRIVPLLPWWAERALILLGGLWFVNLVNFMDGIDWMTVAEVVPVTAGLVLFGAIGALPPQATLVALALGGAMIGFAPFNRPVARLFLGDVGSLPIGLLLGWLLVMLAGGGHFTAAVLLPLYYLADATVTLLRRLRKGEPLMQAHRSHFYQRAIDHGFSVPQVVGGVFAMNVGLVTLAAVSLDGSPLRHALALALGFCAVSLLLWRFSARPR